MDTYTTNAPLQSSIVEPPEAATSPTRGPLPILLGIAGVVVALVTVVLSYVLMRNAGDSLGPFVAVISLCLVVLAVFAAVAGRVGGLATFVAIALVLPWTGTLAAVAAVADRLEAGVADIFGDSFGDGTASPWTSGGKDDDAEDAAPVPLGESTTLGEMTVSITGSECTSTLSQVADNPEYWSSTDADRYLDAQAPAGKQFCTVTSRWTNDSSAPGMVSPMTAMNEIVDADGTSFAGVDDDASFATQLTNRANEADSLVSTLNPGEAMTVVNVFTVPAGREFVTAQGVQFSFTEPEVLFALR